MHWAGENKKEFSRSEEKRLMGKKRKAPKGKDMKEKEVERKKDTG